MLAQWLRTSLPCPRARLLACPSRAMEILHTLRAGDAVIARLHDGSSNGSAENTVDAIVVNPMSIGAGGNAMMLVDLLLPNGQREQRTVPAADLQLPQRRSRRGPAIRLGDSDGWGEVPDRCWATSAAADEFEHAGAYADELADEFAGGLELDDLAEEADAPPTASVPAEPMTTAAQQAFARRVARVYEVFEARGEPVTWQRVRDACAAERAKARATRGAGRHPLASATTLPLHPEHRSMPSRRALARGASKTKSLPGD